MSNSSPTVYIVDDDQALRCMLTELFESVGIRSRSYGCAAELLAEFDAERPGCLVLDLRLPGMSGLELQEHLAGMGSTLPVVLISGYVDVPTAVRAMKAGAVEVLQKPFSPQILLDTVQRAISQNLEQKRFRSMRAAVQTRLDLLTGREREVLNLVVAGKPTKQIAAALSLSYKTVENHRSNIMEKMGACSAVDLVRLTLLAVGGGNGLPGLQRVSP